MPLSDKAIAEFKELVRKKFRKKMSDEVAREHAESFLRLVLLTLTPTKEEIEFIDSLSAEEEVLLSDLDKQTEQLQLDV